MRTQKQIKEMIKRLEAMNIGSTNDYLRMVNQGSINALEWVIEQ